MIRYASTVTVFVLSTLLSLSSWATPATSREQVKALQELETLSYKLATNYFMYTVTERNPQQRKKLDTLIMQADQMVTSANVTSISSGWSGYKSALNTNPYNKNNEVDQNILSNIDQNLQPLASSIKSAVGSAKAAARLSNDINADLIYDDAVLMESLTAEYLRRAADPMGGSIVASSSNASGANGQEQDPEQMALRFSTDITKLMQVYKDKKEIYSDLKDAYRYWGFIKNRMIDFNSKSVPYIVATYNEKITAKLQDAYGKVSK